VRDPQAFLMDEPLSNLDAKLRVQMRTEVSRLQKRLATTTVYVTHDQTEAMTLGDRVAVMRSGILQQVGPPQELYNDPANLFVAGFIGSPAMNFMPARLEQGKLRTKLGDIELGDEMRRALEQRAGDRDVILGVRPESFEDAALVPADVQVHGVTFSVSVDVLESMGSDVFAYFTLEGGPAQSAELEELARDSGRADTGSDTDQIVARLDAETKIREGENAKMWADTRAMHVFDLGTALLVNCPASQRLCSRSLRMTSSLQSCVRMSRYRSRVTRRYASASLLAPSSSASRNMRTTGVYSSAYQRRAISARSKKRCSCCMHRNPQASTASPSSAYDQGSETVILACACADSGTRDRNIRS